MILYILLALSTLSNAVDSYIFKGNFNDSIIYHYQNMLLIREVKHLGVEAQPKFPLSSYISDMTDTDCIMVLKPKSHFVIKSEKQNITVNCYDKAEKPESFSLMLDAGHGGKDPGAISLDGVREKDITLDFVKKLHHLLDKRFKGRIKLMRNKDIHLDKYQRLQKILEEKPNVMVSVHADAFCTTKASGFGALYLREGDGSEKSQEILKAHDALASSDTQDASKNFAQSILNDLKSRYHLHHNTATPAALVILRSPWTRSILLELGFLSNPEESKKLANTEYITGLATDLSVSIEKYILEQYGIIKTGSVD